MNRKIYENARFTPKGDIEANWKKATGFVPLDKEIIIYKPDENHSVARMKIGDGVTGINDLPFMVPEIEIPEVVIPQSDWNENDTTSTSYIKNRTHWIGPNPNNWTGVLGESVLDFEGEVGIYKIGDNISSPARAVVDIDGWGCSISEDEIAVAPEGSDYTGLFKTIDYEEFHNNEWLFAWSLVGGPSTALSKYVETELSAGTYLITMPALPGAAVSFILPDTYHKIDNKYLDIDTDAINNFDFNFKTDWNQNDSSSKGYIRNRTHFVAPKDFEWSGTVGGEPGYVVNSGSSRYPTYTWYCTISDIPYDLLGATVSGEIRTNRNYSTPYSVVLDRVTVLDSGSRSYSSSQGPLPFPIISSAYRITTSKIMYTGGDSLDYGSTMTITKSKPILKLDSKYLDETTVAFKSDLEDVAYKSDLENIDTTSSSYTQLPVTGVWNEQSLTYNVTLPGVDEIVTGLSFIMVPDHDGYSISSKISVNGSEAATILYAASLVEEKPSLELDGRCYSPSAGVPYKVTYNGTNWIIETNETSANNISGTLSVKHGGTGKSTFPNYGILISRYDEIDGISVGDGGAFYADQLASMPKFGTLPIPQGGTGATTPQEAFNKLAANGGTVGGNLVVNGEITASGQICIDDEMVATEEFVKAQIDDFCLQKPSLPTRDSIIRIGADGSVATTALVHESAAGWSAVLRDDDGCIKTATPKTDGDATTKKYVDDAIGDIETVLDSIISIQNSLIGGDA